MRFKEGICPNCKHELQIDSNKITSTCPFCGMNYDVPRTISSKDVLLQQKLQQEEKKKNEKKKSVEIISKHKNDVNKSSDRFIFIAIIASIIGCCLILAFVYPKQEGNDIPKQSDNVESTIAESISDKNVVHIDITETESNINISEATNKETVSNEKTQENTSQKSSLSNKDLKSGENLTYISTIKKQVTSLIIALLSIMRYVILFGVFIGFFQLVMSMVHENSEGVSYAICFMLIMAVIQIVISIIIKI